MTESNERDAFQRAVRVPGTKVRKRFNPGVVGQCTGKVEGDSDDLEVQVSFNGQHPEWELADNLELVNERPLDPVGMLLAGQAGRARDLRRELARSQLSGRLSDLREIPIEAPATADLSVWRWQRDYRIQEVAGAMGRTSGWTQATARANRDRRYGGCR